MPEQTASFRARLTAVSGWNTISGVDLGQSTGPRLLANFGRHLFEQSKHYSHYSETLNAVPTNSLCCADHLVMLGTWLSCGAHVSLLSTISLCRFRWASTKVMEVYRQEASASTYLYDIGDGSKQKVLLQAMGVFPG